MSMLNRLRRWPERPRPRYTLREILAAPRYKRAEMLREVDRAS